MPKLKRKSPSGTQWTAEERLERTGNVTISITMPAELRDAIRAEVGPRGVSEFVCEAARRRFQKKHP